MLVIPLSGLGKPDDDLFVTAPLLEAVYARSDLSSRPEALGR